MIQLNLQSHSLELDLVQNSNPLITWLVFLVTSRHSEAIWGTTMSHLISIAKTHLSL